MKFSLTTRLYMLIYCLFTAHIAFGEITRDLELDAIFEKINYTCTNQGKKKLQHILANPINNIQTLTTRQDIISSIASNSHLHSQLTAALTAFNKSEPVFEDIVLHKQNVRDEASLAQFYFSSDQFKKWNYSPIGLELGQCAYIGNLMSSFAQHALSFAFLTWGLGEEHVCASHPAEKHHDDHNGEKHDCSSHAAEKHHLDSHHHCGHNDKHNDCHHDHHNHHSTHHNHDHSHDHHHSHDNHHNTHHSNNTSHAHENKAVSSNHSYLEYAQMIFYSKHTKQLFQIWHSVAQIQELYSIQSIVTNNAAIIKQLQSQLITVANGIRTIKSIRDLLNDHAAINSQLLLYKQLDNLCNSHDISKKLTLLLHLLQKPTFTGDASVFSRVGNILAAYALLQDVAHELQPALEAIGEIDAYTSCAHLLLEHQKTPTPYTFAQYKTDRTTPYVDAHNFWHPLINTHNPIINSITLAKEDCTRNIVITGPNACGKSTTIKALILGAYCAQTISLVPAEKFCLTPFEHIYSSMVVTDNIEQNKSLFITEFENAEKLLKTITSLAPGEYMFIALDELFKSTHHTKGQKTAYKLLETLHAHPQVITIVATHFEELLELEQKNGALCKNYTMNNFKLEPGTGAFSN